MKTKEEIINSQPVFLNNFEDSEDVFKEFDVPENEASQCKILFASYGSESYEGDAFVLYTKDGELLEVNGGHCSCYGLEGQFDGEYVVLSELENRLLNGNFGKDNYAGNNFNEELKLFLGI